MRPANPAKRQKNERLLSASVARANQFKQLPYFLAGDFNVEPQRSAALSAAMNTGVFSDIFARWAENQHDLPPTFCADGVHRGMEGPGTPLIDYVLANPLERSLVTKLNYE